MRDIITGERGDGDDVREGGNEERDRVGRSWTSSVVVVWTVLSAEVERRRGPDADTSRELVALTGT